MINQTFLLQGATYVQAQKKLLHLRGWAPQCECNEGNSTGVSLSFSLAGPQAGPQSSPQIHPPDTHTHTHKATRMG